MAVETVTGRKRSATAASVDQACEDSELAEFDGAPEGRRRLAKRARAVEEEFVSAAAEI